MLSNIKLAEKVLSTLYAQGVRHFIVCAGARNAPLVKSLSVVKKEPAVSVYSFFEERSASFFGLGLIKKSRQPVAVLTTSGTAASELYSAVIEAQYSCLPLVCVTADRPREYRGTGAPQSIEQVGLYAHSVAEAHKADWSGEDSEFNFEISPASPSHLNVCFAEPLLDEALSEFSFQSSLSEAAIKTSQKSDGSHQIPGQIQAFFSKSRNPLVVVSELPSSQIQAVKEFLLQLNQPVYLEAQSGLRGSNELSGLRIQAGEKFLARKSTFEHFDGLIRIGSVPTFRLWRNLETDLKAWPVLNLSQRPFSGLSRSTEAPLPLKALQDTCWAEIFSNLRSYQELAQKERDRLQARDSEVYLKMQDLLSQFSKSEPAFFKAASELLSRGARVFLGNSLPIREWDLAAQFSDDSEATFAGNRGVNGIDGVVSTFLGWCSPDKENVLILGDLSALYDLAGLWPASQGWVPAFKIIVINNGGGKIFRPMFKDPIFENPHRLEFSKWGELFGIDYRVVQSPTELRSAWLSVGPVIIEVQPDEAATQEFYTAYENLIASV